MMARDEGEDWSPRASSRAILSMSHCLEGVNLVCVSETREEGTDVM